MGNNRTILLSFSFSLVAFLSGCGGGGSTPPSPVSVSLAPSSAQTVDQKSLSKLHLNCRERYGEQGSELERQWNRLRGICMRHALEPNDLFGYLYGPRRGDRQYYGKGHRHIGG